MKNSNGLNIASLATIATLAASFPVAANAAGTTNVTAADGLGGLVYSAAQDIANPVGLLIIATAYIVGFWLAVSGLMSLVKASNGDHHRLVEGLLKLVGCAFLCALPDACGVGVGTFFTGGEYSGNLTTAFANHAVADCTAIGTGTQGITCMAKNIGMNLVPVFVEACFVLMVLSGFLYVGILIYQTAVSANERGGRGIPAGWVTRLGIAFLICNAPALIGMIETTLGFGSSMITATGAQGLGQTSPPVVAVLYIRREQWGEHSRHLSRADFLVLHDLSRFRDSRHMARPAATQEAHRRRQRGRWDGHRIHYFRGDAGKRKRCHMPDHDDDARQWPRVLLIPRVSGLLGLANTSNREKIMGQAIDFATADLDVVIDILKEIFGDELLSSPDVELVTTALESDTAPCPKVLATDGDVESLVRHFDTLWAEWGTDGVEDFPEPPTDGDVR